MSSVWDVDLSCVRAKFVKQLSWWRSLWLDVNSIEMDYRYFLEKVAENPGTDFSPPSQDVDDFWHLHILDTEKYARDCKYIAGRFIHHVPAKEIKPLVKNREPEPVVTKREPEPVQSASGCYTFLPFPYLGTEPSSHQYPSITEEKTPEPVQEVSRHESSHQESHTGGSQSSYEHHSHHNHDSHASHSSWSDPTPSHSCSSSSGSSCSSSSPSCSSGGGGGD